MEKKSEELEQQEFISVKPTKYQINRETGSVYRESESEFESEYRKSQLENEAFELYEHSYWVDINDRASEGRFISESSGQPARFLKWGYNEPSSSPGDGDCVELNDAHCLSENFYICEF